MRAFKLFTGSDGASHVQQGSVKVEEQTEVISVHFKESPPHTSLDWHDAPQRQYVLTLSGTLEFTTRDGEVFVLRPGVVLVATDTIGSGHRWRLIDDDAWRRCYVVLKPGAPDLFVEGDIPRA